MTVETAVADLTAQTTTLLSSIQNLQTGVVAAIRDSAGIDRTFATKADATAALPGLVGTLLVQVLNDESQGNTRTLYKFAGGALTFATKIAYLFSDLSNASPTSQPMFGITKVGGDVPKSIYNGGVDSLLRVAGLSAFKSTTPGEFRFESNWDEQNAISVWNHSNNDGYSTIRYLDYQGRETCAFGWGNPGTTGDYGYAGAAFWESSTIINADGSQTDGIAPHPMRIIQSGFQKARNANAGASGSWTRIDISSNGDFNFCTLTPIQSTNRFLHTFSAATGFYSATFRDADDLTPVLRTRNKNAFDRKGVVIGDVWEGGKDGNGNYVPPAQVALDVGATSYFGNVTSLSRAQTLTAGSGNNFAITIGNTQDEALRFYRDGVGKVDMLYRGTNRLDWVNGDTNAILMSMDASRGLVAFNGTPPPVAKPILPAALPTDGSATPAALASAFNALRAVLIGCGLASAA